MARLKKQKRTNKVSTFQRTAMEGDYTKAKSLTHNPHNGEKLPCKCSIKYGNNNMFGEAYWVTCDDATTMAFSERDAYNTAVLLCAEAKTGKYVQHHWVPKGWTLAKKQKWDKQHSNLSLSKHNMALAEAISKTVKRRKRR